MARANWHTPELVDVAVDPFAAATIQEVGVPIRLDDEQAQLRVELVELVRREAELYTAGVECEIKYLADTSCHACPLNNRGELCHVGRSEEAVCTRLAVIDRGA